MKSIGFIDFYIDEWHANNYPTWIQEDSVSAGRDCGLAYAWADTVMPGGQDTNEWCNKHGVKVLSTVEELVEKSDYIIVLSPDNPEHHERLSRIPLMSGKPVFIDKTFSPDYKSGVRMFKLAEKYGTPMFSSSALRFSEELSQYPDNIVNRKTMEYVATSGSGSYNTYSVHQFEIIVTLMGCGADRIKSLSSNNGRLLVIEYPGGRRASMLQMQEAPFQVTIQLQGGDGVFISECSDMFPRQIHAILDFFETGRSPVPKEETLEVMALIDAGSKALSAYDTWVMVDRREN